MSERRSQLGARRSTESVVLKRVKRGVESAFDDLDIYLFEERLPPLLKVFAALSDEAQAAVSRPGRLPVAWLRINGLNGRFRETDGSRGHMASPLQASPDILDQIRRGERRLILDSSHEGRAGDAERPFKVLEGILTELGVGLDQVMILTQNSVATDMTSALAAETGHGVFAATTHSHLVNIWRMMVSPDAKITMPHVGFAAAPIGPRPYRYTSLNYTIRGARALLVGRLLARGEPGYMSFSTERSRTNKTVETVMQEVRRISLPGKRRANTALVQRLFDDKIELKTDLGSIARPVDAVYQLPEDGLRKSELFLVTETELGDARLSRFTEKTIKAVIAGIPFVVFGNKGTVSAMRNVGFDVFDGLVDHTYDDLDDPRERFDVAWRESARLLDLGPGLVDRNRVRIEAANAINALAFEDNIARQWIEDPLLRISQWAASQSELLRETA